MDLCLILPTSALNLVSSYKYQLALAHMVLTDKSYAQSYKQFADSGCRIILDNSLWELGTAMSAEDLMHACREIGDVYELILPDAFKSADETITETEAFLKRVELLGHPWERNFVVPHGADREDWLKCYDYFIKQPYTDTIGLPKVLDDIWSPGGRVGCCMFLEATNRIDPSKQYHALGIRHDPLEILLLSRFKWIRSLDTALPIHAGLSGVTFDAQWGLSRRRPKRSKTYFETSMQNVDFKMDTITHNIQLLQEWSHGIYQKEN